MEPFVSLWFAWIDVTNESQAGGPAEQHLLLEMGQAEKGTLIAFCPGCFTGARKDLDAKASSLRRKGLALKRFWILFDFGSNRNSSFLQGVDRP